MNCESVRLQLSCLPDYTLWQPWIDRLTDVSLDSCWVQQLYTPHPVCGPHDSHTKFRVSFTAWLRLKGWVKPIEERVDKSKTSSTIVWGHPLLLHLGPIVDPILTP